MTLHRSVLRAKAIDILTAANIVPAGAIYRAKLWKTQPEQLPCIVVFTRKDDQTGKGHTAPPQFTANPRLDFEIGVKGDNPADIEDDLDSKCDALITALLTSADLMLLVERVVSITTEIDAMEGEYQYFRARIGITFEYTELYEPVLPNLLNLVDVTFTGPNGDPVAEVKITPQA